MSLGDAGDGLRVRPYAITGGRTRAATEVPIEAIVYRTPKGEKAVASMSMERRQILDLLSSPQSAAEISGRLRLPLGVARVVVGDLVDEGCLAVFGPHITDNCVPTREAIEERFKVPALSVTGKRRLRRRTVWASWYSSHQ